MNSRAGRSESKLNTAALCFVERAVDLDPDFEGTTIVLDPGWVPDLETQPTVRSALPAFSAVLEDHDLFREALEVVDGWAGRASAEDRVLVEGVSFWLRFREPMWHWAHERLLWRYALRELGIGETNQQTLTIPWSESALLDVARAMSASIEISGAPDPPSRPSAIRAQMVRRLPQFIRHSYRFIRPHPDAMQIKRRQSIERARDEFLNERLKRIVLAKADLALVLSQPRSNQAVGLPDRAEIVDPNLQSAVSALAELGLDPLTIGWGISSEDDEYWPWVENDESVFPGSFVRSYWARAEDAERVLHAVAKVREGLSSMAIPFHVAGLDLSEAFNGTLIDLAARIVGADVRDLACVERLLTELSPRSILMTHEGHRTPWLMAAAKAAVPTFALQHGVLYAHHPGYPDRRDSRNVLPSCTFVFGDFERRALLAIGYLDGEVEVSGSPRLDLDGARREDDSAGAQRASVRAHLGIAPSDRLLVVSTGWYPFMRRTHIAHMLATLLASPLPNVHIVFKQHPGELDEGPYMSLVAGLARAGGYEPPRMSVVKDIDLYRLLRAADAHLGHISTLLTEAVVAGTSNLVAAVQASPPPIDYVGAGVGFPVTSSDDLANAMRSLPSPSKEVRERFLNDHFRPGHAGRRIASKVAAVVGHRASTLRVDGS